jgi:hypothetical protein
MAEQKAQLEERIQALQDQYQKLQAKCDQRLHDKELQLQQMREQSQEQLTQMQTDMAKARNEANAALEAAKKDREVAVLEIKKTHAIAIQSFEVKIEETRTFHEEKISKKVAEHNDAIERVMKSLAIKEKELGLAKEKGAARERELMNEIEDLHHDAELLKKMNASTVQELNADFESRMKKKETQIEEVQELMSRKLVEMEDDAKKAWKAAESKMNRESEERINKVKEDAQTKVDAAVTKAKSEKTESDATIAKLDGLIKEKDSSIQQIMDKELRGEDYLNKEEARLKKEMKLQKSELESQITSLHHDVEMLVAQKKREVDDAESKTTTKCKVKDSMIDTLKHEIETSSADAKRRMKETTELYESKLKLKEDTLFEARTEIARLRGLLDTEEDEEVTEEIDIVVERTVTVMQ